MCHKTTSPQILTKPTTTPEYHGQNSFVLRCITVHRGHNGTVESQVALLGAVNPRDPMLNQCPRRYFEGDVFGYGTVRSQMWITHDDLWFTVFIMRDVNVDLKCCGWLREGFVDGCLRLRHGELELLALGQLQRQVLSDLIRIRVQCCRNVLQENDIHSQMYIIVFSVSSLS